MWIQRVNTATILLWMLEFYYYSVCYFQAIVWSLAQEGCQGGVLVFNGLHVEMEGQNFFCFIRFLLLGGFSSSCLIHSEENISTCENFSKLSYRHWFLKEERGIFCTDVVTEVIICHSLKNTLDLARYLSFKQLNLPDNRSCGFITSPFGREEDTEMAHFKMWNIFNADSLTDLKLLWKFSYSLFQYPC